MLHFFRQIRQRLFPIAPDSYRDGTDNKFSKYMMYAVGEILLVVIGILIAIQVDNWNEQRKDQFELTKILEDILQDMKMDIANLNDEIVFLAERSKRIKSFINTQNYDAVTRDSLELGIQTYYYKFPWQTSGFEKLRNSGITDYGEFEVVINSINLYYTFIVPLRKYREEYDMGDMVRRTDNFWRYEQNTYELNYPKDLHHNEIELHSYQSNEEAKKALITLLRMPKVRNILKTNYRKKNALINDYQSVKGELERIVGDIENVLN